MYCEKFECGDITNGRAKLQSNADYVPVVWFPNKK